MEKPNVDDTVRFQGQGRIFGVDREGEKIMYRILVKPLKKPKEAANPKSYFIRVSQHEITESLPVE